VESGVEVLSWSTDAIDPKDRFAVWRETLCAQFNKASPEISTEKRPEFWATMSERKLARSSIFEIQCMPHKTVRTHADAQSVDQDFVHIYRQVGGPAIMTTPRNGEIILEDRALYLSEPNVQFSLRTAHARFAKCMVIKLPRKAFENLAGRSAAEIPSMLISGNTGIRGLLTNYVDALAQHLSCLSDVQADSAIDALTILASSACGLGQDDQDAQRATGTARLQAAKDLIVKHAHDPDVDAEWVATRLRISLRSLHRVFEPEGKSIAAYLRSRRLELARDRLRDSRHAHLSIADLAYACGFDTLSTFNRQFRAVFGTVPRDWRRQT
jgi:AraC-like DNA-binding protein